MSRETTSCEILAVWLTSSSWSPSCHLSTCLTSSILSKPVWFSLDRCILLRQVCGAIYRLLWNEIQFCTKIFKCVFLLNTQTDTQIFISCLTVSLWPCTNTVNQIFNFYTELHWDILGSRCSRHVFVLTI